MPTLNWIGKDKVVNHHQEVPFHTLEHKYGFRGDDTKDKSENHSGNMIIHGDNLLALKASFICDIHISSILTLSSILERAGYLSIIAFLSGVILPLTL